ncbi:hypothetical protein [Streptomyces sp. NPDC014623]|uniref:hypothetical protein n=1 Tax=Streptomyces sp. NPDC014623 TaxID=3364875 RepID=UPI0036FFA01D
MTDTSRRQRDIEADGRKLYRELLGPLSTDTPAEEFGALNDSRMNRIKLAHIAQQGGTRGAAARGRLSEWESNDDRPPAA